VLLQRFEKYWSFVKEVLMVVGVLVIGAVDDENKKQLDGREWGLVFIQVRMLVR
jgi:hypothetical protein